MEQFWTVNIGHLITIAALLVSFWSAHWSNVRRIKEEAERWARLESKVSMLMGFFEKTWGVKIEEMKAGHGE